jgi:hypothetical protein
LIAVLDIGGNLTEHELPEDFLTFCYKQIGCDTVDLVRLSHGIDMWVDDEGLYTQMPNRTATVLAREMDYPAQVLCGNVVLTRTNRMGDTVDLEPEDIDAIKFLLSII